MLIRQQKLVADLSDFSIRSHKDITCAQVAFVIFSPFIWTAVVLALTVTIAVLASAASLF